MFVGTGGHHGIADRDDIIGLIYEAAADLTLWPDVLDAVSEALGGCGLVMSLLPRQESATFVIGARVDLDHVGLIREGFATGDTNALVAAMPQLPVATLVHRQAIQGDAEYLHSDLYNHVFRPLGLSHFGVACLLRTRSFTVPLGVLRQTHCRRPDQRDVRFLGRLLPHMQRSLRMYQQLASVEATHCTIEGTIDLLSSGVIIVDGRARVLHCNRAAERLVADGDGLTIRRGRLNAATVSETDTLHQLVDDATATPSGNGHGGGDMALRRSSLRQPLVVAVLPLPQRSVAQNLGPHFETPAALVIVRDPEASPEPRADVLRRLYGFTPAEADLAHVLACGGRLSDYAEQACVTAQTARWHLKNVLAKTNTHRQSELVRLLLVNDLSGWARPLE